MKDERTSWAQLTTLLLLPLALSDGACRTFDGAEQASAGERAGAADSTDEPITNGGRGPEGGAADAMGGHLGSQAGDAAGSANDDVAFGGASGDAGAGFFPGELPPLEPSAFAGLALWLEASPESCRPLGESKATSDQDFRISTCLDASGHRNHGVASEPLHEPLLVHGAVNGHAALKFDRDPSLLTIEDSTSLHFGQGPFAVLAVIRWNNSAEYVSAENNGGVLYAGWGEWLGKVNLSFPYKGIALFANYPGLFGDQPASPRFAVQLEYATALFFSGTLNLNDNRYRLLVARRPVAGVGRIRINGQDDGSAAIPAELDVSATGQPMILGGWSTAPFRGEIAELIAIGGAMEDTELERLEHHLLEKYALLGRASQP